MEDIEDPIEETGSQPPKVLQLISQPPFVPGTLN